MNFEDLINLADVDATFRETIRHHYMLGTYQIDKLRIRFDGSEYSNIFSDSFIIGKFTVAAKFLRNFGDMIKKLEYSNKPMIFTPNETEIIDGYIEQYCSPTLEHIVFMNAGQYLISEAKQQFTNVNSVEIMHFSTFEKLELRRIFPKMEQLKISINYPVDLTSVVREYPNLRHLEAYEWGDAMDNTALLHLIELNSGLQALTLNNFPKYLQRINENLPNLKSLALTWNPVNDLPSHRYMPTVHFKNVTNFYLNVRAGTLFENDLDIPITFERLEVLEIDTNNIGPPIQRFIEGNEHLTHLTMTSTLTDASQLSLALDTINEANALMRVITIRWVRGVDVESVQKLFEIDSMQKIIFVVGKGGRDLVDVENVIPSGWWIIDVIPLEWVQHLTIARK